MHSYTAFVHGGIRRPSGDARADGSLLANKCLQGLKSAGDAQQFPPQLLILLVSPAYLDLEAAGQLVGGIREVFERSEHHNIKLVGTSVAAVFFDHEIHEQGALLVCLASRLLDVRTGVGKDASRDPEAAVGSLLGELQLGDHGKDLNPMSNRMLLTFFPDITWDGSRATSYASDMLHSLLWNSTLCRIPIAGGVSSGYIRYSGIQGLQFCDWNVYTDTLVAAQVDSGVPLGVSLCRGLEPLKNEQGLIRLRVKGLSEDGLFIEKLEDSSGRSWVNNGDYFLLSEDTSERDFILGRSETASNRFRILDKVSVGDTVQVRRPRSEMLLDMAADIVDQANKRVHVGQPLACLSLICSTHFHNIGKTGTDIQQAIESIESKYHTCVGGFVDGEAGVDPTGRSQFGNWSMVGIGFGDEMRDRTPLHRGFQALAAYSPRLTEETKLGEAIRESLNLIFETGFPGAMISFPLRDQNQEYIVGMDAVGERFRRIVGKTRRPLDGKDALAKVIKSRQARFIPDTREDPDCDPVEKEVLVSQYVIPLRGPGDQIIAALQIDLGKTDDLSSLQQGVLDSLGAAVGSGLNRILNWEVVEVARELDRALKASLSAETLKEGLQSFIKDASRAFGASMGHVRIADVEKRRLVLVAGVGDYYEAAKVCRTEIDFDDDSPTCEAYSTGKITIVNDARHNRTHYELLKNCRGSDLEAPLAKVASYANTAFRGQGPDSIGTINLVSDKAWFFTWQHQHSLKALGERVGFLVEHLEQKEKKAEASRRLDFLLNASPQLNRVQNFDDMFSALREAIERFRTAANAQIASLYLWDERLNQFILRAQSGWQQPAWVNAARYRQGEGWIGKLKADPLYDHNLTNDEEHYVQQMFGDKFGEGTRISAIGLPLRVREESLGVLALYRGEDCLTADGFTKIGFPELRDSADSIAALLSILISRQETSFSERMQEHFKKISKIFLQDNKGLGVLEKALCKTITEMFGAAGADFYFYGAGNGGHPTFRSYTRCGFRRNTRTRALEDELVTEVRRSGRHRFIRREITDAERADPTLAATEGQVMRLCTPVFAGQTVAGVLNIRWDEKQRNNQWAFAQHSDAQLRVLGTVIGSAHNRYRLAAGQRMERRSKEVKQRGVQAMNALQLQSAHHFKNLLTILSSAPDLIRAANSDQERAELADELNQSLEKGHTYIVRLMELAKKGADLNPGHYELKPLLQQMVSKSKEAKGARNMAEMIVGADDVKVYVDYECIAQAITNIVDNAIDSVIRCGGASTLKINVLEDRKGEQVEIVFENRGGMTAQMIEAAKRGQWERRNGRKCSGIYIASHLVHAQGGIFDIESDGKTWTRVHVTLPLGQLEED